MQQGQPDEALRHLEQAKKLFTSPREQAIVTGEIAKIQADKGEVDAALQLHQERLGIFEALGAKRERAQTLWSIAEIEIQQQKWQGAFDHLSESYAILVGIGALDGIYTVGLSLGQLLCMAGQREQGVEVLTRSRDGFQKLGRPDYAQQAQSLLDQVSQ